ncbi:MAG: hypothetical protein K2H18_04415 [Muribaculaceae bacterium]|nr:hypothetical protein [Muribaculaceae bacterium]
MNKICRKIAFSIIGIVLFLSPSSIAAEEIFEPLVNMKQVESAYVSGRFAHTKKIWRSSSGRQAMDLSQGFSSLYSYQCYSTEAVNEARKLLNAYLKKHPDMQLMMRTKQDVGEYLLYEHINKDNRVMKMIIWNSDAPNICDIVVVDWKNGLESGKPYSDK